MIPPTPKPSINIISVLQESFKVYQKNLALFLTISAVVLLPLAFISTLVSSLNAETLITYQNAILNNPNMAMQMPTEYFMALFYDLGIIIITVLAQILLVNSLIIKITEQTRLGKPVTGAIDTLKQIAPQLSSVFLSHIILFMIIIALSFGLAFIAFACGLGIGILIYISMAFSAFLLPIYIIEKAPLKEGIQLNWALGRKYIWLIARLIVLNIFLSLLVNILIGFIQDFFINNDAIAILLIINTVGSIIIAPIFPIAVTILYDNILQQNHATSPFDLISPEEQAQIINRQDIINMGILSIGLLVFAVITLLPAVLSGLA